MDSISKLAELFKKFPGIGARQSKRFVYFLLSQPNGYLDELSKSILSLKKSVSHCGECFRFFAIDSKPEKICPICRNTNRDRTSLMIVEKEADLETIERSSVYKGLYFVLGGAIPMLEKAPEERVRLNELLSSIEKRIKEDSLKEIILALGATTDGEYTEDFIIKKMKPLSEKAGVKVSILGRGLSTGTEIEYVDSDTIKNALKNRS